MIFAFLQSPLARIQKISDSLRKRFHADYWLRNLKQDHGVTILHRRRVYVLPTRYGILFAISLGVFLLSSINYDLSLGFVLTFFLASAGNVAILHTVRNLVDVRLSLLQVSPVFAGDTLHFTFLSENRRGYERASIVFLLNQSYAVIDIPPQQSTVASLNLPTQKRGWLNIPRITIETRYPLGLLRSWGYWKPEMPCLVYPQLAKEIPPLPPSPEGYGGGSPSPQGQDDFAGLRHYQAGDNPRRIAWKAAARAINNQQPLPVKIFHGESGTAVVLDYHYLPAHLNHEERLSWLTTWVVSAEKQDMQWTLKLPTVELGPAQGTEHLTECLRTLALYPDHP